MPLQASPIQTRPARLKDVDRLDLHQVMDAAARKQGWSDEDRALAERDYRQFLRLVKDHPDAKPVPSEMVDDVWHSHILFTRQYAKDCQDVFGYFLHHRPYVGGQMANHAAVQLDIEMTKELFGSSYGLVPHSYRRMAAMICAGGCAGEPDR